jgi:hypothetical protein
MEQLYYNLGLAVPWWHQLFLDPNFGEGAWLGGCERCDSDAPRLLYMAIDSSFLAFKYYKI